MDTYICKNEKISNFYIIFSKVNALTFYLYSLFRRAAIYTTARRKYKEDTHILTHAHTVTQDKHIYSFTYAQ